MIGIIKNIFTNLQQQGIILFVLHLFFANAVFSSSDSAFYNSVLSKYPETLPFYISLKVKSENYTGYVIMENYTLSDYLTTTMGLNRYEGYTYMKNVLENKEYLVIKNDDIERFRFTKIIKNNKMERKSKNPIKFIETYVELIEIHDDSIYYPDKDEYYEGIEVWYKIKKGLSIKKQNFVIHKLFEMQIPVIQDCYTGFYSVYPPANISTKLKKIKKTVLK